MSKCVPTTKSCREIANLIGADCGMYVQMLSDPVDTHGLYGVPKDDLEYWKGQVKKAGGKYIRVVSAYDKSLKIIRFALEITPQEELEVKMKKEKEERYKQAYESKLADINMSILLANAGATSELGKKMFATSLLNGSLDPLLPFESYVFIDDPRDKDEKRIYDIIRKANDGDAGCVGMVTTHMWKMYELANRMNKAITDENKRARRRAACLKYGLNFLAECFTKLG